MGDGSTGRIWSRRGVVGLVLVLVLAGCTGSGDPPGLVADVTRSPEPATSAPTASPIEPTSEATETSKIEPLADLGRGAYFVNVRTGEAARLPRSITAIPGAGNYDVSPDGSMILFDNASLWTPSDEPVERGLHQLYVANVDGTHVRQLTDDPVGASQGSWSPDGTKVVYLGGWARLCCWLSPADLMVRDLATGTSSQLAHGPARSFDAPIFSADGDEILFTRPPDPPWGGATKHYDLWAIPVDGGRPGLVLEDRGYASYSPDGATIAFPRLIYWQEGNSMATYLETWISDPDGHGARRLVRSGGWLGTSGQGRWSPNGRRIFFRPYGPPNFTPGRVRILDMVTGRATVLSPGSGQDWLDDETLIVVRGHG